MEAQEFVAVSGTMRARLRVFVAKHFFSYRFDYRNEWLRLTRLLASGSPQDLPAQAIEGLGQVLYREGIGAQTAYIAARRDGDAIEPVRLELLYRGLCREPGGILAALPAGEASHV